MKQDEQWNSRRVLVTGGASGIGRATVLKLSSLGAEVVALDKDGAGLKSLANHGSAGSIGIIQCNLASPEAIASTFKELGPIDGAVNCAGLGSPPLPVELHDLALIDQLLAVNVRAIVLCMQAEIKSLRQRGGGSIVNVSSTGGLKGTPGMSVYCATKHAILGLTRSVAAEVVGQGIRVNAICPGMTETPMLASLAQGVDPEMQRRLLASLPIGRLANADEIADGIVWLLSRSASYVVGAAICIDGGVAAV